MAATSTLLLWMISNSSYACSNTGTLPRGSGTLACERLRHALKLMSPFCSMITSRVGLDCKPSRAGRLEILSPLEDRKQVSRTSSTWVNVLRYNQITKAWHISLNSSQGVYVRTSVDIISTRGELIDQRTARTKVVCAMASHTRRLAHKGREDLRFATVVGLSSATNRNSRCF
jgi:hypothetical protein